MTTDTLCDPVICGQRETRGTRTYECVMPADHPDRAHYWVLLVSRPGGWK